MIAYAIVLLTDLDDVNTITYITVQLGTDTFSLHGEVVRSFVRCTNEAYAIYPKAECLEVGLKLIPPEFRPLFEHLYKRLGGIIV